MILSLSCRHRFCTDCTGAQAQVKVHVASYKKKKITSNNDFVITDLAVLDAPQILEVQ